MKILARLLGVFRKQEPEVTVPRILRHARGICPICGRDVAITKNNLTFYHKTTAAAVRNPTYHTVSMLTGQEV